MPMNRTALGDLADCTETKESLVTALVVCNLAWCCVLTYYAKRVFLRGERADLLRGGVAGRRRNGMSRSPITAESSLQVHVQACNGPIVKNLSWG